MMNAADASIEEQLQTLVAALRRAGGVIDVKRARRIFRQHAAAGNTIIGSLVAALAASSVETAQASETSAGAPPVVDSLEDLLAFGEICDPTKIFNPQDSAIGEHDHLGGDTPSLLKLLHASHDGHGDHDRFSPDHDRLASRLGDRFASRFSGAHDEHGAHAAHASDDHDHHDSARQLHTAGAHGGEHGGGHGGGHGSHGAAGDHDHHQISGDDHAAHAGADHASHASHSAGSHVQHAAHAAHAAHMGHDHAALSTSGHAGHTTPDSAHNSDHDNGALPTEASNDHIHSHDEVTMDALASLDDSHGTHERAPASDGANHDHGNGHGEAGGAVSLGFFDGTPADDIILPMADVI